MKQLFFGLLLLLVANSYAQDTIYLHGPDDTIATIKEKALYYKTINTGVTPIEVNMYYKNGNKYSKVHFSSLKPEIKEGEYERYFYNGNTNIKGTFINNKMEGAWLVYNKEKDFIEEKTNFKSNLREGKSFTFYENGKLRRMDVYVRDTLRLSTCYDSIGSVIECSVDISTVEKEVMPKFPGGVPALMKFISANINPKNITKNTNDIDGKVIVKFYIDIDGSVKDPVVLKNNTGVPECETEAIRIVSKMPKWIPGSQKGKSVKVYYTLPVTFDVHH